MPPSLVLRPKPLWRVLAPAAAVGYAALAVRQLDWPYLLGLVALVFIAAYAWRAVLVVQDGVLANRGLWRWQTVDLQRLRGVTLHWETFPGGVWARVRQRELHVRAPATSPAGDVDAKTRRRLAAYA